jgi:outer membrane protein TolC
MSKLIFKISVFVVFPAICVLLAGCSPEHYKVQADKQVYDIIDKKWDPNFGDKTNYRVSDVNAGPNDINVPLPTSGVINLAEAVAIATAHNRDYQQRKEDLYTSALTLTSEKHRFEPSLSQIFSGTYNKSGGEETINTSSETGVDWLLGTGTAISGTIAVDWVEFLSGKESSLGSVLSGDISQPLLRGRNPLVVKERLTQAERNTLYQIRSFNLFRQDFLVGIVTDYYRVLQALDQVRNSEATYNSLKKSEERIQMLAQAGEVPNFEVDQARQSTLQVYDDYVAAKQNYEQALDDFKIRMSVSPTVQISLDQNDLGTLAAQEITEPNYSESIAIQTAVSQRLDLANAKDQVEDSRRKIIVAEDALGADLDFTASAAAGSENRKLGDINFEDGDYSAGLALGLPLDRLSERNSFRQSLLNLQSQKRRYDLAFDNVVLDVRQSFRDLQEAAMRYQIQQNSKQLAEKRVENVNMLLLAGRKGVTTRDLLDAQSALLSAQNALTAAIVNHTIAKIISFAI